MFNTIDRPCRDRSRPCGQVTTCPYEWDVYLFMMLPDRKLNRLSGYDYSKDGLYFVTSCVLGRACVFGTVVAGEMQLNTYGRIAERQWFWLAEQYPYILLHAFVVMPNHIHGIIEIDRDTAFGTGRDQPAHKIKSLSGRTKPPHRKGYAWQDYMILPGSVHSMTTLSATTGPIPTLCITSKTIPQSGRVICFIRHHNRTDRS